MEVISYNGTSTKLQNTVITIGTFDGVHIGHQTILHEIADYAKKNNQKSALITFWPHPRLIIESNSDLKLLSTFEEKVQLVSDLGIDYIIKIPFSKEFAKHSANYFLQKILIENIGMKTIYIGYDHRFGNKREGDITFLRRNQASYNYKVHEIKRQDLDEVGISSTRIRKALLSGEVHYARELLGRPYTIHGSVVNGEKIGRKLGFPTANIQIAENYKLLPADGVYAVEVLIYKKKYQGMLNIGNRPTVGGIKRIIEVHIFEFEANIYNQELTIYFYQKIRNEKAFNSLEELAQQLIKDQKKSKEVLNSIDD